MTNPNWKQGLCALAVAASFALVGPVMAETPANTDKSDKAKSERAEKAPRADKAAAQKKPQLRGHLAGMQEAANLTDAQVEQILAVGKRHAEARHAWKQAHGERMKQLQEQAKAAEGEQKAEIRKQMESLTQEIRDAEQSHRAQVMAVLSPEQATRWLGYEVAQQVKGKARKLDLSADQQSKVEAIATDVAAKQGLGASTDHQQLKEAVMATWQRVQTEVLTDAQTSQLKAGRPDKAAKSNSDKAEKANKDDKPYKSMKDGKSDKADKTDKR